MILPLCLALFGSLTIMHEALYIAYEAFVVCRLQPSESADAFLVDLRLLAALFGIIPKSALPCAFAAGLE